MLIHYAELVICITNCIHTSTQTQQFIITFFTDTLRTQLYMYILH